VRLDKRGRLLGGASQLTAKYRAELFGHHGPHVHARIWPAVPSARFSAMILTTPRVADDLRSAVAAEGILLHDDVVALLLGTGLGQATESDFGVRVDATALVVVDRTLGSPRMLLIARSPRRNQRARVGRVGDHVTTA